MAYACICHLFFVILWPILCVRTESAHVYTYKEKMKNEVNRAPVAKKIALIGYGKMGHMIEQIALERGHEIVGIIDPTLAVSDQHSVISFNSEAFLSADVAIEFTTPATAKENILRAWAQGVPVVCGTTGWNLAFGNEVAKVHTTPLNGQATHASALPKNWKFSGTPNKVIIKDEMGKTMLVWSSNFSVGVNIFFDVNKFLAEKMEKQPQYTPRITETHHIHKLDKPSGTAKTLANDIMSAVLPLNGDLLDSDGHRQSSVLNDVPIESIREGEVPGTHEVMWDSEEDTIVITHIAKGRRGFALGAVLAAEQLNR